MTTSNSALVVAVFFASAVEMVEALTIFFAVKTAVSLKIAALGALCACLVLGAIVAATGPAIVKFVPISILRIVIGAVLLYFGTKWLRKAVLRAAGLKAKHDENKIFQEHVAMLEEVYVETARTDVKKNVKSKSINREGFYMSFNGVFIEGLEVVIIVISLGGAGHNIALASVSALAALVIVTIAGAIVSKQLSSVPENAMKTFVGIMLVTFGTFWLGEGVKLSWPGSDLFLFPLFGIYGLSTYIAVQLVKHSRKVSPNEVGAK